MKKPGNETKASVIPDLTTSDIFVEVVFAMNPKIEKTTSPPKIEVAELIRHIISESVILSFLNELKLDKVIIPMAFHFGKTPTCIKTVLSLTLFCMQEQVFCH